MEWPQLTAASTSASMPWTLPRSQTGQPQTLPEDVYDMFTVQLDFLGRMTEKDEPQVAFLRRCVPACRRSLVCPRVGGNSLPPQGRR